MQLTQEAKIAPDFFLFRAIFAFAGFVSALNRLPTEWEAVLASGVSPSAHPRQPAGVHFIHRVAQSVDVLLVVAGKDDGFALFLQFHEQAARILLSKRGQGAPAVSLEPVYRLSEEQSARLLPVWVGYVEGGGDQ